MNGPRIYNAESPQEREARLRKRQARMVKAIHKRRRNTIMIVFAIIFVILGVQMGVKISQNHRLNEQVVASKKTLKKTTAKEKKLTTQRDNLEDPDYVAKFIRNKFMYSKSNEKIYNIPNGDN